MKCDSCEVEFHENDEIEVTYPAIFVAGEIQQSEEEQICHADAEVCEEVRNNQ